MKKLLNYFHIAAFSAVAILSGCDKEDDAKPAPTMDAYVGTAGTNSVIGLGPFTITYTATAGEGIEKIDAVAKYGSNETNVTGFPKTNGFKSSTSHTDNVNYTLPTATEPVSVTFTVTDKKGSKSSKTIDINKVTAGAAISQYDVVLLGAQKNATEGSFFSSSDGSVLKLGAAGTNSGKVDFLYYNGATNKASIAAPSDAGANDVFSEIASWTTKNATKIEISDWDAEDFDAITESNGLTAAAGSPAGTSATQLAVGDVVAFETVGGKSGLFKVTEINGDDAGSIKISVKVEK